MDGPHEPFIVECRVATPVALNHPWLHLDGIVAHLASQRALGRDYYNLPTKQVVYLKERVRDRFPHLFRSVPHGSKVRVPCASISFFEPERLGSLQYFKRFEAEGFPRKRKRVVIGNGHYRVWMLRTVYEACEWVRFWGNGHLPTMRELLADLTHLGNDTRIGWGRIAELRVEACAEDWSVIRDGKAQRPIPVSLLAQADDQVALAWRAPYWSVDVIDLCAPPGAEIRFHD